MSRSHPSAPKRGFKTRNEIVDFHSRKLVFIEGPEGVTVELAEWHYDLFTPETPSEDL